MPRARSQRAIENDERIKQAARTVFLDDPEAPITAVARAAGMGISALYSRYESKDALLRSLGRDGLAAYLKAAERAVQVGDPAAAFDGFLRDLVAADTHAMSQRLAGTFEPTPDLQERAEQGRALAARVLERAQAAGAVRSDLVVDDLSFVLEQVSAVRVNDLERTRELRARYLELAIDGLRPPAGGARLPGPPPAWAELAERWDPAVQRRG